METSWWPDTHHSAPEQKCILCWQAPEAAPLILFPHLRTVCMFFWRIQDHLRQHSYICCSASTLLSLTVKTFPPTFQHNIIFPVPAGTVLPVPSSMPGHSWATWHLWTPPGDFSITPNSDLAVSHWMVYPALQDNADWGAVWLRQNTFS